MAEIVYVLTNEYMPGLVKIGMTQRESVQTRIDELSRHSGVPVAFTCHYAAALPDGTTATEVEKILHQLFGEHRVNQRKEFFKLPAEKVVLALSLARATEINLALQPPADKDERMAVEKAQSRRSRLSMQAIGVPAGAQLSFSRNSDILATVALNNQIEFEGELTSLSAAAVKALKRLGSTATALQGGLYWMYEGETLDERRQRMESEQFESAVPTEIHEVVFETLPASSSVRADLTAFDQLMQRETGEKPQEGDQI